MRISWRDLYSDDTHKVQVRVKWKVQIEGQSSFIRNLSANEDILVKWSESVNVHTEYI